MQLLTLDNLAVRYHCLPSEALARATTLDLHILDLSAKYARYQQDLAEGRTIKHDLSQDELKKMIEQTKGA